MSSCMSRLARTCLAPTSQAVSRKLLLEQLQERCRTRGHASLAGEDASPSSSTPSTSTSSASSSPQTGPSQDPGLSPLASISEDCPVSSGEARTLLWEFDQGSVKEFCRISGDFNPIHWDYAAARAAGFDGPIVPGMQCAALFPAIIGTEFPGSIYMSQTLRFRAPVMVGEPIQAQVEVMVALPHRHRFKVTFATKCTRMRDDAVAVDGIAVAIIPARIAE